MCKDRNLFIVYFFNVIAKDIEVAIIAPEAIIAFDNNIQLK